MKKKIISILLALALVFSGISGLFIGGVQAAEKNKILREPTTDVHQMQAWAKGQGADQLFIDLAPIFYDVSVKYGVDPAITYAQSAKETNYMKFTGVLDASFKNPCGLKITAGGDNYDPDAHKRFSSWEEGITAMVHHLCLYAGHEDFPMKNSPDPRHFKSIYGTAPYVEDLGGKWAGDKDYGVDVMNRVKKMHSYSRADSSDDKRQEEVREKDPSMKINRIAGQNKYSTSAEASKNYSDKSKEVILASGSDFADALTANYYANLIDAPILLVGEFYIAPSVKDEIKRMGAEKATILGGEKAISKEVEKEVQDLGLEIDRIAGRDRFETSEKINEAFDNRERELRSRDEDYQIKKGDAAILANAHEFADTLSISGLSGSKSYPILLTNGKEISHDSREIIEKIGKVYIVGGERRVSKELEDELKSQGIDVTRISGQDRYETSKKIAENFYGEIDTAVLASGLRFEDALVSSPLASKKEAPILLTNGKNLDPNISSYLKDKKPKNILIMGGDRTIEKSVSDSLEKLY